MAITLPRASAATVGTGGRGRIARLPGGGDVPQVEVARDPGLSVPNVAQFETGLSDIGAAATDVATRFAEADARINARRNSVERMRARREFNDFANQTFTEFESSRDFSRDEDAEAFGAALSARQAEILAAHQGSEESRLRLEERLEAIRGAWADRGGVARVAAQDALVAREFDEIVNGLAARTRLGEDPQTLINEGMAELAAEAESLRPGQEIAFERALNARVFGAKIDDLLARGAIEDAEDMLTTPEVRAAIGEKGQRRAFDRIATVRREGRTRRLTPAEMAGEGFPPDVITAGLVVQQKGDGSLDVVFKPPADRDEAAREKRIKSLKDQLLRQGIDEQEATDRATNITDGNIRFEIVPQTGMAREINALTGEVREVPLGGPGTPQAAAPEETLFEVVERGNTTGLFPAGEALVGRTVGQVFPGTINRQLERDRQTIRFALGGLRRAMAQNPRFPVGEMERIEAEIEIAPAVFDDPVALLARMESIRENMLIRQADEQRAADDPNLPQAIRSDAARAARDIGNFLNRLGTPTGAGQAAPVGIPEGSTKIGVNRDGKEMWESPDGKRWVVE